MVKDSKKLIIEKAKKPGKKHEVIEDFKFKSDKKNQFVAFFKPEVFLDKEINHIENIINLAFEKFKEYEVEVAGSAYFSGPSLAEFSIMDRHYGVINKLSKGASKELSRQEKEEVLKTLGIKDKNTKIMGGHEVYPLSGMNVSEFDEYWLSSPSTKIRSGFYVRHMEIKNEKIVVVNGFHPNQLAHYTSENRSLILMLLNSNSSWETIRTEMLGETFPEKAKPTSIRGSLFNDPKKYGFKKVGIDNNVMHISAGPTEALFEMHNFLNDPFRVDVIGSDAILPSKLITEGISPEEILNLINIKSIHDELEHKDTDYAVKFLKTKKKN